MRTLSLRTRLLILLAASAALVLTLNTALVYGMTYHAAKGPPAGIWSDALTQRSIPVVEL